MRKKKILFINGHLNVGGVEKSLTDILRHIDYSQYDVELLLLEEMGSYATEIPKEVKVTLKSLRNTYGPFVRSIRNCFRKRDWFCLKMRFIFLLMKLFDQDKIKLAEKLLTGREYYDIVVGFRPGICTQIAVYAIHAGKKIVWWHHGEFNVDKNVYEKQLDKCDIIVSVSESCASMLVDHMPEIADKITVISNMIDVDLLDQKSNTVSPYTDDRIQIVTVGRLSPEKHIENVIYAARNLKDSGYSFQWHIVGNGILREELEQLKMQESVTEYVLFEGSKNNPYPYIKNADLYVHSSYVESQGITILEAMALNIPCVVTMSRGPSEFIKNGENGLLVDRNPQALSEGIKRLLEDKSLYDKIKLNTVCPKQFSEKDVMMKIDRLFK